MFTQSFKVSYFQDLWDPENSWQPWNLGTPKKPGTPLRPQDTWDPWDLYGSKEMLKTVELSWMQWPLGCLQLFIKEIWKYQNFCVA